jgi:RNA polymerase sigma-70 factor (ECF subfamily)
LFAICANQARTIATRERRTVPVDLTTVAPDFAPDSAWLARADSWANAAREHQADAALVTRVRTAISQLPPAQRQVVTLRDVEGLSPRQVCEVLSISPTNQRVLLHRGRAGVRSRQQPTGR